MKISNNWEDSWRQQCPTWFNEAISMLSQNKTLKTTEEGALQIFFFARLGLGLWATFLCFFIISLQFWLTLIWGPFMSFYYLFPKTDPKEWWSPLFSRKCCADCWMRLDIRAHKGTVTGPDVPQRVYYCIICVVIGHVYTASRIPLKRKYIYLQCKSISFHSGN